MLDKKLEEIIDFAIEREKEAVKFYRDLQEMTKFSSKKKMLKDLENMEKGHIEILENLKNKELKDIEVPEIQDLHISDYMVAPKPEGELSYQDIISIAIKKEEASYKLYKDLAENTDNENARKLFLKLSSEEAKHKQIFEKIYDEEILSED